MVVGTCDADGSKFPMRRDPKPGVPQLIEPFGLFWVWVLGQRLSGFRVMVCCGFVLQVANRARPVLQIKKTHSNLGGADTRLKIP